MYPRLKPLGRALAWLLYGSVGAVWVALFAIEWFLVTAMVELHELLYDEVHDENEELPCISKERRGQLPRSDSELL
jgi:hypothetical protein